jgi:hypothetical protein
VFLGLGDFGILIDFVKKKAVRSVNGNGIRTICPSTAVNLSLDVFDRIQVWLFFKKILGISPLKP